MLPMATKKKITKKVAKKYLLSRERISTLLGELMDNLSEINTMHDSPADVSASIDAAQERLSDLADSVFDEA